MPVSITGGQLPMTHEDIRALESREAPEALKTLAEIAAAEDQFLRRTAVEVIGRNPQGRELRSIILNAFGDPSEYVVRTACEVVERWALREAHGLVVSLLVNTSKATRQSAIRALDRIWVDADFPMLFRILIEDSEIDVRREAAWVLQKQVTSAHWRMLFDAFHVDDLPRHRQWACELAENFSDSDILPLLKELSFDRDGHVRRAAVQATQIVSGRK